MGKVRSTFRRSNDRKNRPFELSPSDRAEDAFEASPVGLAQVDGAFQLSPAGGRQAGDLPVVSPAHPPSVSASLAPAIEPSPTGGGQGGGIPLLPHYDSNVRELRVNGVLIMPRLSVQARNLAAVLTAIERSGWRPRVAQPLNGRPDGGEPQHLADAVYGLNHHQSVIRFRVDDGAICWEWR